MKYEDQSLNLKIENPETSFFKLFDFTKEPGESYLTHIYWESDSLQSIDSVSVLEVKIQKVINWKDGIEVFMFRVKDNFQYLEGKYDIVYFVSKENGVLGTYISRISKDSETVINPRGEIFENWIDYSSKEVGIFQ